MLNKLFLLIAIFSSATSLFGSDMSTPVAKKFFQGAYTPSHWAVQSYRLHDPKVLALLSYKGSTFVVYLNPTDMRGWRSVVRLIHTDMTTTLNREYTSEEHMGLILSMQLVMQAYRQVLPIVQSAIAGNNAHAFDPQTGDILVGKAEEPSFLHAHVWGRGNPEQMYVPGVKLQGPIPGLNFDMMAKTPTENGNEKKITWKPEEMAEVAHRLKEALKAVKDDFIHMGMTFTA